MCIKLSKSNMEILLENDCTSHLFRRNVSSVTGIYLLLFFFYKHSLLLNIHLLLYLQFLHSIV